MMLEARDLASSIIKRVEGNLKNLSKTKKLMAAGFGMAAAGGAAATVELAKFADASVHAAAVYQQKNTLLVTQAGVARSRIQAVGDAMLQMAPKFGETATNMSDALYHVASAGIAPAKQLATLKAAAMGAAIGNANLEETTNALVGALRSGVGGISSAKNAMATILAIVGTGNMRLSDFNAALGTGLPGAAKTFGVSLQSAGAALAYLTDTGMGAQMAATRLTMAMALLGGPSAHSSKILHALGLTSDQVKSKFAVVSKELEKAGISTSQMAADMRKPDGIVVALQDLKTHMVEAGLSADTQAAVISRAFGGGHMGKAIMQLIGSLPLVRQKFDQINKSVSGFGQHWIDTTKTAVFQAHSLHGAMSSISIAIGEALLPVVQKLLSKIVPIVGWIASWATKHKTLAAIILGSIAGFTALAAVIGVLGLAVLAFQGEAAPVIAVILGIIAVVALLAAGAYLIYRHWGAITKFFSKVWGEVKRLTFVAWNDIREMLSTVWNRITGVASTAWTDFKGWMSTLWGDMHADATTVWNDFTTFFSDVWSAIKGAMTDAWNAIKSVALDIWGAMVRVGEAIWSGIQPAWQAVWGAIGPYVKSVWDVISGYFHIVFDALKAVALAIWDLVNGRWGKAWDDIKAGAEAIWNQIKSTFHQVIVLLGPIAKTVWDGVVAAWNFVWGAVKSAATSVWHGIEAVFHSIFNPIKSAAEAIWNGLEGIWKTIWSAIGGYVRTVWSVIKDYYSTYIDAIKTAALAVWDLIHGRWSRAWNDIKSGMAKIWGDFKGVWDTIWGAIGGSATKVWDGIASAWSSAWSAAVDVIKAGVNEVLKGINALIRGWDSLSFSMHVPGWVPLLGGKGFDYKVPQIAQIPMLGAGGIAMGPTLALIGEAGPEAVVPLSRGFGGGAPTIFDFRGSTFMSDYDINMLTNRIGGLLATQGLPASGMQVRRR